MIWKYPPVLPPHRIQTLAQSLSTSQSFPEALAQILIQRGIQTYEQARKFFVPELKQLHDPFLMQDMTSAVERLVLALDKGEKVLLLGDYDVDGTTSVALWAQVCQDLQIPHLYYIPDRYTEGYGVSYQGIDFAQAEGCTLMITLDCGIKALEQIRYATLKGLDVIICDHHQPGETLPQALAVLDPKRVDDLYPYKELTGCGVGLKLAQALVAQLRTEGFDLPSDDYDPLHSYADLLALSIACDIVPITGENRVLAYLGLQKLRSTPSLGLAALMDQATHDRQWDISDLVFFIGPRINAAGRLEHANAAVEVLLARSENLIELANALQDSNDARKDLDRQMTEEALALIEQTTPSEAATTVLYQSHWHKGIIGIVASRLIETYYRPTVLLTASEGKLVGSARSVPGFDLYQALEACDEHILQWGGHKYAAGLTLQPSAFEAFRNQFERVVTQAMAPELKEQALQIDASLPLEAISDRFVRLLNRMEPFGPYNRRPVFQATGIEVLESHILKEKHVRLRLEQNGYRLTAIGFNLAEKWERLPKGTIDIAFQPVFNTWNNQTRIDLRLRDIKPTETS